RDKPPLDAEWQEALGDFLIKNEMQDQFWWCLNPDSGDTGGLVEDDWTTPVAPKLDLLARVQPSPTQVRVDKAGKVTFS
ncbi:hypothetical protein VYU27_007532, partial [Nannochloropsis oceanica]